MGAYAIAVLDKDNPDGIIAARKSSPLVVGIGEGEFFLASDATPIVEYTDKVVYLEDEEIALIRRGEKLKVVNLKNVECPHEVKTVALNLGQLEKGGYPHFMLKEIFEQPGCIHDCMRGRINVEGTNVVLSAVIDYKERLLAAKRFVIVACGTSWHAALIGKHLIESFCRIPVEVEYASEFRYRDPVIDSNDVVIAISQSGETADTLAAVELARNRGAFIYGICNAVGSSIPRATHTGSYIHVGPEIGGGIHQSLHRAGNGAYHAGPDTCQREKNDGRRAIPGNCQGIGTYPRQDEGGLETERPYSGTFQDIHLCTQLYLSGTRIQLSRSLGRRLEVEGDFVYPCRGLSCRRNEARPHCLVDAEMPVVVIATRNGLYEKVLSNIQEIKARKGRVIAIVTKGDTVISKIADTCIELPETMECLDPLITTVPLQLLAYHIAVCKGMDVDQPRNLAKSVTVE